MKVQAKKIIICSLIWAAMWGGGHRCTGFASTPQNPGNVIKTEWRKLSSQEETRFVSLAQRRTKIAEELAVLKRLFDEKESEKRTVDNVFLEKFNIAADSAYRFDRKSRALYRILRSPGNAGNSEAKDVRPPSREELHKTLTEAETKLFLRCAEAQERIQVAIQGIHVLNIQKANQWKKVRDELLNEFGIQPDADYSFDKGARTIYRMGLKSSPLGDK